MTSREQYVVPATNSETAGFSAPKAFESSGEGAQMNYLCADCGIKNTLRRTDPIRCKECGGRVLYKQRTKRQVNPFQRIRS
ncbi:DNA-directed RNA polymerases I, II, and III subunit RPABC4 [Sporothrix schenckii 1099-18]|uniref:DNA-directed RNA polymerases I, II, and III subunit RPABC4 n=1 Tax=Sporothrix schenckii 1099-18 TaxID=1397361 RepID=A0A0F2M7U5_SPOSC|nr:DNA-directed RNA polymerases I, II, and III subunit RPABC4 [Sporothrix schenckii 1099-18]KJR84895.1 DNA-directed RNA polymerases I, II, and III subunit RPABC4 [Sporothrix schenckii 1099-18]